MCRLTHTCPYHDAHAQAQQEYERRLKEELELKAIKEREIAELVSIVLTGRQSRISCILGLLHHATA